MIIVALNGDECTPLDDYVHAPDPHFAWTLIQTYEEIDYKLYVLNFTSQKWLDGNTFSRPSRIFSLVFRELLVSVDLVALLVHHSSEETHSTGQGFSPDRSRKQQ